MREREERQLRIDQMTVNIEKMRSDLKWETCKFALSAIIATAAAVGAGVGIGNLIWAHPQPPSPPAQIIFQPGAIQVAPSSPAPGK